LERVPVEHPLQCRDGELRRTETVGAGHALGDHLVAKPGPQVALNTRVGSPGGRQALISAWLNAGVVPMSP